MSSSEEKVLSVVTYQLDVFTEGKLLAYLIKQIAYGSDEIPNLMNAAHVRYAGKGMASMVYKWTRTRDIPPLIEKVTQQINEIKDLSNLYNEMTAASSSDAMSPAPSASKKIDQKYELVLKTLTLLLSIFEDVVDENGVKLPDAEQNGWEHGSYNYYFFDELIQKMPGFRPMAEKIKPEIFPQIRDLMLNGYKKSVSDYKVSEKAKTNQAAKIEEARLSETRNAVNIVIKQNLEEALESLKAFSDKFHFYVHPLNDSQDVSKTCALSWVDFSGKLRPLDPPAQLIALFKNNQPELKKLPSAALKQLKLDCHETLIKYLDNEIKLVINPHNIHAVKKPKIKLNKNDAEFEISYVKTDLSDEELTRSYFSHFVLRGDSMKYNLIWITPNHKMIPVALENYPRLLDWLNIQGPLKQEIQDPVQQEAQDPLQQEQYTFIKSHLLQFDTTAATLDVEEDFKTRLMRCLVAGPGARAHPISEEPPRQVKKLEQSQLDAISKIHMRLPSQKPRAASSQASTSGAQIEDSAVARSSSPASIIHSESSGSSGTSYVKPESGKHSDLFSFLNKRVERMQQQSQEEANNCTP